MEKLFRQLDVNPTDTHFVRTLRGLLVADQFTDDGMISPGLVRVPFRGEEALARSLFVESADGVSRFGALDVSDPQFAAKVKSALRTDVDFLLVGVVAKGAAAPSILDEVAQHVAVFVLEAA